MLFARVSYGSPLHPSVAAEGLEVPRTERGRTISRRQER